MSTPKPARASSDRLLSQSTTKTMSQWPPECRRWHRVRHSRRLKKESEKQIPQCTPSLPLQIIMSIWPRAIAPDTEHTIPNSCRDHSSVTKLLSCHFRQRLESHRTDSHELHRAKPGGKRAKPGDNAHAACCGIFRATAQTGPIGISTGSLARVPDGSGPARCIHGFSVYFWCAV